MVDFAGMNMKFWGFFAIYAVGPIAILLLVFKPKEFCLSRMQLFVLFVLLILYSLIGAKAFHIILYYHKRYMGTPLNVVWRTAGSSSIGFYIFACLTAYIYSRVTKKSFLEIFDYFVLAIPLTIFFVRIGCLISGCCYGSVCILPWATVSFQSSAGNVARHPTQAYEMIYCLAILITTLRFYGRLSNIRGATFFSVFFAYFFMRFFNEFLRTDSPFVIGPLKLSHLAMMAGIVLCGIGFYYAIFKKGRKKEFFRFLPSMIRMFVLLLVIIGFVILGILTIF